MSDRRMWSDRLARRIAGIADPGVRERWNLGLVPAIFYRFARRWDWFTIPAWQTDRAMRKVHRRG